MPRMTGSQAAEFPRNTLPADELSRIRRALEIAIGQPVTIKEAQEDEDDEEK